MIFALTIVIFLALGVILYLMVRALPRVAEEPAKKNSFLDRWARSRIPEKIDDAFNGFLIKFLRRVKVLVLKFDNAVSAGLRKATIEEKEKTFQLKDLTKSTEQNAEEKSQKET
jgi:hypothetical protein